MTRVHPREQKIQKMSFMTLLTTISWRISQKGLVRSKRRLKTTAIKMVLPPLSQIMSRNRQEKKKFVAESKT